MSPPKVSVIITTYNRRPLLARAIASVMAQEERDFELIVVDDGSTDDTRAYLATLTDPRLRVIASPRNVGIATVRNLGLEAARADVVAMVDDDDVYLPRRLSVPLALLAKADDVVATLSSVSKTIPKRTQVQELPSVKLPPAAFEWALAAFLLNVEGTGLTFRRRDAIAAGGFDTRLTWHEDREFMIRLARRGGGWLVGETLWQKNWSADGLTTRWERAGPSLVRLCAARPEYTAQYRKVGSYLATQILVADLRKGLFGALLRDLRDFRAAGLIGRDIAWLWRNHRSFRRYRRAMSKPQALASLVGPPQPQP